MCTKKSSLKLLHQQTMQREICRLMFTNQFQHVISSSLTRTTLCLNTVVNFMKRPLLQLHFAIQFQECLNETKCHNHLNCVYIFGTLCIKQILIVSHIFVNFIVFFFYSPYN